MKDYALGAKLIVGFYGDKVIQKYETSHLGLSNIGIQWLVRI